MKHKDIITDLIGILLLCIIVCLKEEVFYQKEIKQWYGMTEAEIAEHKLFDKRQTLLSSCEDDPDEHLDPLLSTSEFCYDDEYPY